LKIDDKLQRLAYQPNYSELKKQPLSESGCSEHSSIKAIQEAILARVKEDFHQDRVINYNGWVLSQTELGICHLSSLA
jgi:hypothetical protein